MYANPLLDMLICQKNLKKSDYSNKFFSISIIKMPNSDLVFQ